MAHKFRCLLVPLRCMSGAVPFKSCPYADAPGQNRPNDRYKLLDLQLKGYDYVVLEKYQSYLHKTMKKMNFEVTKSWSVPHQELQLENLGDRSSAIETSYKINIYERNLQMKDAHSTKLPILIDVINMTSPPGVSFSLIRHSDAEDDRIYFRDSVLEKLKEDLQELKDTPLIGVS